VQAMTILRIAGVSIPPQLMREPERGYRGKEPIVLSVSRTGRESKYPWDVSVRPLFLARHGRRFC
jgi:hypothetical protein